MARTKLLMVIFFVLASCDTPYDVFYDVENLTDETVFIEFRSHKNDTYGNRVGEATVAPGETARVVKDGGVNARDYVPPPCYDQLPRYYDVFNVYVGGVLLHENVRLCKHWEYFAKKLLGVHTLRITEELVIELELEL